MVGRDAVQRGGARADPAAAAPRRGSCRRARSPTRRSPNGSSSTCSSAAGRAPGTPARSTAAARSSRASWAARACSWWPARTARRARSTTSAATAARACSTSPRAACGGCSAPTTRGPTASTACCATPPDERFDPACFSLREVRSEVLHGLVFVDVSGEAPPLAAHVGALAERLAGHRLGTLRRAAGVRYDVAANWKAIVQNYSECLHCPGVHPELNRLTHYLSGVDHEGPGAWCGGSMTLNEGVATMGRGDGWPAIAARDEREVLYYALLPNALDLAPSRLRDAAHAVAARGGPHGDRLRVVLRAVDDRARGLRPRRRGRLLGHRQPPGLARLRAHAEGRRLARVLARPLHGQRAHGAPVRPDGLRGLPRDRPRLLPAAGAPALAATTSAIATQVARAERLA